jgi:hemerythrin-like metal-binding protein
MAEWTPELTVNVDLLDHHHVELFRLLARGAAALDAGDAAELGSAVDDFADALIEHVAVEEALMEESLWPERGRHKSAHELFVADLVKARTDLRAGGPTPAFAEWLRVRAPDWLRFHIQTNDVPFGAHLARRRQQAAGPHAHVHVHKNPPKA